MTYICEEHGDLESEWCEQCEKIVECDCKNQTVTRFKDMIYDSKIIRFDSLTRKMTIKKEKGVNQECRMQFSVSFF